MCKIGVNMGGGFNKFCFQKICYFRKNRKSQVISTKIFMKFKIYDFCKNKLWPKQI
jgi:hypothetical protein